jgi:hypothetical protein
MKCLIALACAFVALAATSTDTAARNYIKADRPQLRAYSPAVVTEGGKIATVSLRRS